MKYRKGYKYQLAGDVMFITEIHPGSNIVTKFIELRRNGSLLVRSGYAWDGPSGPTFDRKSNMRGSLAHDALYQLLRQELLVESWREKADELICSIWIEDGMWPWLARMETRMLKRFAGPAADPKNAKKVYEVP